MNDYPCNINMTFLAFDRKKQINPLFREHAILKDAQRIMAADMSHSRQPVPEGGQILIKLLKNVDSLQKEIQDKEGNKTTLRRFILEKRHEPSEKRMFMAVRPAPTLGNSNIVRTEFTSRRSNDHELSKIIAIDAQRYVMEELASDIWETFGKETTESILGKTLLTSLEMDDIVQIDTVRIAEPDIEIPSEIDFQNDLDSLSTRSAYQSAKTTESTRAKFEASQDELKRKTAMLREAVSMSSIQTKKLKDQSEQIDDLRRKLIEVMKKVDGDETNETPPNSSEPPDNTAPDPKPTRTTHTGGAGNK